VKKFTFLSLQEVLSIHEQEIQLTGGEPSIRDLEGIKACIGSPQATFGGNYLNTFFEMAAVYVTCITMRHPFVDGNKRTALASALTFLYLNGYEIKESHVFELTDLVVDFVTTELDKDDIAQYLRDHAQKI
jgi:death-on-curing protein